MNNIKLMKVAHAACNASRKVAYICLQDTEWKIQSLHYVDDKIRGILDQTLMENKFSRGKIGR